MKRPFPLHVAITVSAVQKNIIAGVRKRNIISQFQLRKKGIESIMLPTETVMEKAANDIAVTIAEKEIQPKNFALKICFGLSAVKKSVSSVPRSFSPAKQQEETAEDAIVGTNKKNLGNMKLTAQ